MIVIAIIRMSKFRIGTQTDIIWEVFWHEVEACTAVITVSLSAFRYFFVAQGSRQRENRDPRWLWYMSKKNLLRSALRRKKLHSDHDETNRLPKIPRATMTGMRTFIKGENRDTDPESQFSPTSTMDVAATSISDETMQNTIVNDQISTSIKVSQLCDISCPQKVVFFLYIYKEYRLIIISQTPQRSQEQNVRGFA